MGWHIANIDNTVKLTDDMAKQLFELQEFEGEYWYELDEVCYEGEICFNEDHMEHMDNLMYDPKVIAVFTEGNAKGRITFGDLDGDNFGSFWGWDFDGQGNVQKIKGRLEWDDDKE